MSTNYQEKGTGLQYLSFFFVKTCVFSEEKFQGICYKDSVKIDHRFVPTVEYFVFVLDMLFTGWEIRIGKKCAQRLWYATGRGHSFPLYGPT